MKDTTKRKLKKVFTYSLPPMMFLAGCGTKAIIKQTSANQDTVGAESCRYAFVTVGDSVYSGEIASYNTHTTNDLCEITFKEPVEFCVLGTGFVLTDYIKTNTKNVVIIYGTQCNEQ